MNMKDESKVAGGVARSRALSAAERSAIAKKGAAARWGAPQAEYAGEIALGDMQLPCSVLSDETRVLTQSDFMAGMGMYYSGWVSRNRSEEDRAADVPQFLGFKSLQPFVAKHLGDLESITISYRTERGTLARGIRAEIIPKICDVWIDAAEQTKLGVRQKAIADKAKIVMRALAHVGIIALVDEATGYQNIRRRDALQAILDAYLNKELAAWAKRFPDEFYEQIYRLRGWEWKGRRKNPPQVVAAYTKDFIYERLAPGIYDELRNRMPITKGGNRKGKLHQLLTEDIGHPALAQHVHAVTGLMRAAGSWSQFKLLLDRAYPKKDETMHLALDEPNA